MLLENIFCASLMLFCIMLIVVTVVSRFSISAHRHYDIAIMLPLLLSGLVTIITAIMWILRAWG
jgi:uncharacterized membrane protein YwaF